MQNNKILFVTGLSGAGISTCLKALEDCGYEVFDNFPLKHIETITKEDGYQNKPMAFGLDTRTRAFSPERIIVLARELNAKILFLNATNADLQKRFSETRRVHPMATDRTVTDGIVMEREILAPFSAQADQIIDTTDMSVHDLKRMIEADYRFDTKAERLSVTIMSFGFKRGVPREVDMVIDVRFLKNPHWEQSLKPLTGQNKDVQAYIDSDKNFDVFFQKISDDILWLLPRYAFEGKSYFTIAFGCTGGKHRSVYTAEKIAKLVKDTGYPTIIRHRDMPQ
jgi:UPF0042 nucleotide-binding protein